MSKVHYLEVVEMLSEHVKSDIKKQLHHILARKSEIAEENKVLDDVMNGLLVKLKQGKDGDVHVAT